MDTYSDPRRASRRPLSAFALLAAAAVWPASSGLPAQITTAQRVSHLLPVRVDGDRCGDLLTWDGDRFHVWHGLPQAPFLREGVTSAFPALRPFGAPIQAEGLVWVANMARFNDRRPAVDVARLEPNGRVARIAHWPLDLDQPERSGVWPRLVMPEPGDDVATVLWSEVLPEAEALLRVARVGPDTAPAPVTLPLPTPGPPHGGWRLIDAFPAPPLLRQRGEVMFVLAGAAEGLAFGVCGPDPVHGVMELRGYRRIPCPLPLRIGSYAGAHSAVRYGGFAPTAALPMPVVTFATGGGLVLHPRLSPPYVDDQGAALWSSDRARMLVGAEADYDLDGTVEIVLLERGVGDRSLLAIVDPHPLAQTGGQVFPLPPGDPDPWLGLVHRVFHAAPLDVDGDGRLDLVASMVDGHDESRFVVLRGVDGPRGRGFEPHW